MIVSHIENTRAFSFDTDTTEPVNLVFDGYWQPTPLSSETEATLNANGALALPGLIDLHCTLPEPGARQKGTIASETGAAAKGGITTLCCTPDTRPPNDSEAMTHLIRELLEKDGQVRVHPIGALTKGGDGKQLAEIALMTSAGCIAVSHSRGKAVDPLTLYRCFQYAASQGVLVVLEPGLSAFANGCLHEGKLSCRLGLVGQPSVAESVPVASALLMAEETGARLHLGQISCRRSVELIAQAKAKGVQVTADVAILNLVLTESNIRDFDTNFHLQPPLRTEDDRQALLQGVRDGTIDAISSHHQPQDPASKSAPFAESAPGASTLELMLSLGLKLIQAGELSLSAFVRATSLNPARILYGASAELMHRIWQDIVLTDTESTWTVNAGHLLSKGKNTPLLDDNLPGTVTCTLIGDTVVYARPDLSFG